MIKPIFAAGLMFLVAACNNASEEMPVSKKETTKTKAPSIADSYSTDTMYQALPQLVKDLSAEKNIENLLAQNWTNVDDIAALRDGSDGALEFPVRTFSMFTDKTVVKKRTQLHGNRYMEF